MWCRCCAVRLAGCQLRAEHHDQGGLQGPHCSGAGPGRRCSRSGHRSDCQRVRADLPCKGFAPFQQLAAPFMPSPAPPCLAADHADCPVCCNIVVHGPCHSKRMRVAAMPCHLHWGSHSLAIELMSERIPKQLNEAQVSNAMHASINALNYDSENCCC